jgi:hypothetical protein
MTSILPDGIYEKGESRVVTTVKWIHRQVKIVCLRLSVSSLNIKLLSRNTQCSEKQRRITMPCISIIAGGFSMVRYVNLFVH